MLLLTMGMFLLTLTYMFIFLKILQREWTHEEDIALIFISFFFLTFYPDKMPTIFTSKTHHTTSKSQFGGAIKVD